MSSRVIKVKSAGDMARQVAMHRYNALALSLLTDLHVVPPTAAGAQKHPLSRALLETTNTGFVDNKAAKTSAPGGEFVQRLERNEKRLDHLNQQLTAAQELGEDTTRILTRMGKVVQTSERLRKTLAEIDEGVRTPKGLTHLYDVSVASLGVQGWDNVNRESEHWILNTQQLSPPQRSRLERFLRNNTGNVLPYEYRADHLRYYANNSRPESDRTLMADLWGRITTPQLLGSPSATLL